jgi:hypothetical protein
MGQNAHPFHIPAGGKRQSVQAQCLGVPNDSVAPFLGREIFQLEILQLARFHFPRVINYGPTGCSHIHAVIAQHATIRTAAPFYQGKTLKIINNDPGGTAGMRVKAVIPYLRKYIPGNPTIVVEFIEGGGGRRAANHVFRSVNADGLTVGALSSSVIGLNVMRETGVMYDIDKFIYLGTPVSENHNVI